MKALVYQGANAKEWTDVPDPVIRDIDDAIIQVDATTICGSDVHILKGDVPTVTPGRVLGHEAVGTIIEVGSAVSTVRPGDRSSPPASLAVGAAPTAARVGTANAAAAVDGSSVTSLTACKAQYARIPFADMSTYKLPARSQ
jgi:alcohol dehydrogenase